MHYNTPRRAARITAPILVQAVLLGGCVSNPYASSLSSVDEKAPQRPAAIQVSEPQLYARETLINDRRREAEYLDDLIERSQNVYFEPQLKRVIQSYQALRGAAEASYAPAPAAKRAEELSQAQQEISLKQKQIDLATANLNLLKAQQLLQAAQAATTPSESTADSSSTPPAASADVTALTAQVKALQDTVTTQTAAIEALKGKLDAQPSPTSDFVAPDKIADLLPDASPISPSSITASPLDLYHDRQAYRDELRAAQAAVQLDDGHDVAAHALYRLQFQTTVVPGANKNKFAIVDIRVQPKTLDEPEITSLYRLWLGHVAFRSNGLSGPSDASRDAIDPSYVTMAASGDLFRFIELNEVVSSRSGDKPWRIKVVVPPDLGDAAERVAGGGGVQEYLDRVTQRFGLLSPSVGPCPLTKEDYKDMAAIGYIAESLRAMGNWQILSDSARDAIADTINKLSVAKLRYDTLVHLRSPACESPQTYVPSIFSEFIRELERVEGWSAAYATSPVELGQSVSSSAAALQSLQLGLSLSAAMPLQGISGKGSLNYVQAAQGRVEALERLPLAVGYSDRDPCTNNETDKRTCARFGWIFGPRATLDPKDRKIRLEQGVRTYAGTVDLSLPNWWPKVMMTLQTSWVGNWHGADLIEPQSSPPPRPIVKTLRLNRADLDGLTDTLFAKTLGGALATTTISEVEPRRIAPCGETVSLLVFGSNIWRGTEAYLDGVRAQEVRTAPDMAGLYVTFRTRDLVTIAHRASAYLVIWTRNGPSEHPVRILPSSTCKTSVGDGDAARLTTPLAQLKPESDRIEVVSSDNFPGMPQALLLSPKGGAARSIKVTAGETGDSTSLILIFEKKLSEADATKNWRNGIVFNASVQFADTPNAKGPVLPIAGDMVFYRDAPVLTPTPKQFASLENPATLTVTFPPAAETGFKGFDPRRLKATIGDGSNFPLIVDKPTPVSKGYQYELRLANPNQYPSFKTAERKVSLSVDTSDPLGCTDCVTVKAANPPK